MPSVKKPLARRAAGPGPAPARLKRKNLILDQGKIDRAKAVLGAATETEAITRALEAVSDLAVFQTELEAGFAGLLGKGGFVDHFGGAPPSRAGARAR